MLALNDSSSSLAWQRGREAIFLGSRACFACYPMRSCHADLTALKTSDLWTPIALCPNPREAPCILYCILSIYENGGWRRRFYVLKLPTISTRESSTFLGLLPTFPTGFGPFQARLCIWFPWDPEHQEALSSVTASWRKSDDKQETSHLPTSPEGSLGYLDFDSRKHN